MRHVLRSFVLLGALAATSCFDSGSRWESPPVKTEAAPACTLGDRRCDLGTIRICEKGTTGALAWAAQEDCAQKGLVCSVVGAGFACTTCLPNEVTCQGQEVFTCSADGSALAMTDTCDPAMGEACRTGGCQDLCLLAQTERSNVGCEYWGVDLDNAMISATEDAASQQYALVVSNAQPDVPVHVVVYQDDSSPGEANAPYEIAEATIAPYNLQVFDLGPREVDGSPPGQFNTGSNTALTRHAYKVTSDFPVVAFQFNPLDNVNVFSNDASLLKPREALVPAVPGMQPSYVVAGWPQTIAITDDPSTNFDPQDPIQLRAFLAIVGTAEGTTVRVHTKARVVAGGPVPETPIGGIIEQTIGPFDVLNLETGDFLADFSGSVVEADGPIVVFSGSEASDAPHFTTLADRRCCADHLENQLDPIRTAGRVFAIAHNPSRTAAVKAAGADLGVVPEPDFVRFVAASPAGAVIKTTLPAPDDQIILHGLGDMAEVTAYTDFTADSTGPVHVAQVMPSQDASGVPRGLPGGDPSFVIYPPTEQYRANYVFLTPDKYVFNFVAIVAPFGANVLLDEQSPETLGCQVSAGDGLDEAQRGKQNPPWVVYRCQLSFPIINPLAVAPNNVMPGVQNDGVHKVDANVPVGVIVSGFDSYVSYAYAAGTELKDLTVMTQ